MDLVDLYIDSHFKSGETVYHEPTGAIGKVSSFYYEHDETGWTGSLVGTVCVEIENHDHPRYIPKKELTHHIPRFARWKHIYKNCPKYIYMWLYLLGGAMLVTCASTGQLYFDILALISFWVLVPDMISKRKKKWIYAHPEIMVLYGVYLLTLLLLAIRYHILY